MVVAHLAGRSIPQPEVRGSNQSSATFFNHNFLLTVCRKDQNKEKEARNGPVFLKKEQKYQSLPDP